MLLLVALGYGVWPIIGTFVRALMVRTVRTPSPQWPPAASASDWLA